MTNSPPPRRSTNSSSPSSHGGLHLKYRIVVDPPPASEWEKPEIFVDFSGPDSAFSSTAAANCSARLNCWRLKSSACLPASTRRFPSTARISVPCAFRNSAWRLASPPRKFARPERPFYFAPMSSRERRIVHLALRDQTDLRTESDGEGFNRCVVLYPADYKSAARSPPAAPCPSLDYA